MNTTARRLTGLGVASAAATFALAAPASAMPLPPDPQPNFSALHDAGGGGSAPVTVVSQGTDWAQIGYGAAGGIALAAAGVVGIVLIRRHPHLPHHA